MLNNQKASIFIPLVDDKGELLMFKTYKEAKEAARATLFGMEFGYEIFCEGAGE